MTSTIHKLSFNLNETDFGTMAALAHEQGISIGALIRQSLALHFFLAEAQDAGSQVLIEKADGSMHWMKA